MTQWKREKERKKTIERREEKKTEINFHVKNGKFNKWKAMKRNCLTLSVRLLSSRSSVIVMTLITKAKKREKHRIYILNQIMHNNNITSRTRI